MPTPEQKKKLLKAKIAVSLHEELGRVPKKDEIEQVFLIARVMYKAVLGLHFQRQQQKILAQNGARGIALEYDESGNIKDIFFKIMINNKELPFRLPAKAERVYQALWGEKEEWEYKRYGEGWRQQAERISWRICKTWLEAQITLINLEQAKIEEVFLPYLIVAGNKTLFETMEQNHFLLPDKHNT